MCSVCIINLNADILLIYKINHAMIIAFYSLIVFLLLLYYFCSMSENVVYETFSVYFMVCTTLLIESRVGLLFEIVLIKGHIFPVSPLRTISLSSDIVSE